MVSADVKLSILSPEQWESLYKRTDYSKLGKVFPLHYLLALNQPTFNSHLAKLETPAKILLSDDSIHHQLTPLAIACMKGSLENAKAILTKLSAFEGAGKEHRGVKRKALALKDAYGWTPLHHAAVSSKEVYELLLAHGADTKAKTNLGATSEDLLRFVGRIKNESPSNVQMTLPDGTTKPIGKIPAEELQRLTGLTEYTNENFYPEDTLEYLWHPEVSMEGGLSYQKYREKPPRLIVKQNPELGVGTQSNGLYLNQKLETGSIAVEYTGKITSTFPSLNSLQNWWNSPNPDSYLFDKIDAGIVGNAARWANCGWPNCFTAKISSHGISRVVLIAGETMNQGDELRYDYGIKHRISLGDQVLLGRDQMRAYFQQGLQPVCECHTQALHNYHRTPSNSNWAKSELARSRLLFLLNSPAALLDLHFAGLVSVDDWDKLINPPKDDWVKEWNQEHGYEIWIVRSIILSVQKMEASLKNFPAIKALVNEWVLSSIGKRNIFQILKGLDLMRTELEKDEQTASPASWNSFVEGLQPVLDAYLWETDESCALGFHGRQEAMEHYYMQLAKTNLPNLGADVQRQLLNHPKPIEQLCLAYIQLNLDSYGNVQESEGYELLKMLRNIKTKISSPAF